MPVSGQPNAVGVDLSAVVETLFAAGSVQETLQGIVDLAEQAVEGCQGAGILLVDGTSVLTLAVSSPLAREIDRLQIDTGEGPCIDAVRDDAVIHAPDLMDDPRWPEFRTRAVAAGVRTVLTHPLSSERPSTLNLYATLPTAFGAAGRAKASLFAVLARVALESAHERDVDAQAVVNLRAALHTRAIIGQAQGILMERERITADQAFDMLRRASQHLNVKLREVAATLVETGDTTIGEL